MLERLEGRELLAFSPVGFSLPDLAISGFAAPVAAWGGPFAVTVDVRNQGASSMIEPLNLAPGSSSTADAPATIVQVFFSKSMKSSSPKVMVGQFAVPSIPQNTSLRITEDFAALPAAPPGFPVFNGKVFVSFVVGAGNTLTDSDQTNNGAFAPQPVQIEPPLPDLAVVGLDVPPVIQPGDTIQPNIEIANFGTVDTAPQGPVLVALVASPTHNFRRATVIATYTIETLHGLSEVPQTSPALGDVNIQPPLNIETLVGQPVTLPTSPRTYFLSVVVDPGHNIRQINQLGRSFSRLLGAAPVAPIIHQVGPPIPFLPPAGVLSAPSSPTTNPFPLPSFPVNTTALPLTTAAVSAAAQAGLTTQAFAPPSSSQSLLALGRVFTPMNPAQALAIKNTTIPPAPQETVGNGSTAV
jgi:hypothetical protein